jgi:hypothetical protein
VNKYTVLVLQKTGKISAIQNGKGRWGKKECPPVFQLVEIETTPEGVEWLLEHGYYDGSQFVDKDDESPFNLATDVIEDTVFNLDYTRQEELAIRLGTTGDDQSCKFLLAKHLPADIPNRTYWFKRIYPLRKEPGVKALLKAIIGGLYPDTCDAFHAMDKVTQEKILNSGTTEDRMYLEWIFFD